MLLVTEIAKRHDENSLKIRFLVPKITSISLTLESNALLLTWAMKCQECRMKNHDIWQK